MPGRYTLVNLVEIEDVAPANGCADRWQARAARTALDTIRVDAEVARAFEAGGDRLEFLACGPHQPGDGEPVDDAWVR